MNVVTIYSLSWLLSVFLRIAVEGVLFLPTTTTSIVGEPVNKHCCHVLWNLQSHSLQATSLYKDCYSAHDEPYDVDQLVVKYYCSCVNRGF